MHEIAVGAFHLTAELSTFGDSVYSNTGAPAVFWSLERKSNEVTRFLLVAVAHSDQNNLSAPFPID